MSTRILLFLTLLALTFTFHIQAAEKPLVIFFAGTGSTAADLALWKRSAETAMGNFEFETVSYPTTAFKKPAALRAGADTINQLAARLNQLSGRKVILVGHSSGGALAEAVAKKIRNPSDFRLVNLDGFKIDKALQARMHVTCWSGRNPITGATSSNYSSMRANCKNFNEYPTQNTKSCRTEWCLHFALINRSSNAAGGYSSAVNLEWLKNLNIAPSAVVSGGSTFIDGETNR